MKIKSLITYIAICVATILVATENLDEYTVFSGYAGMRASRGEDMSDCKQRCTRGAQQDALYNYFLENHPEIEAYFIYTNINDEWETFISDSMKDRVIN